MSYEFDITANTYYLHVKYFPFLVSFSIQITMGTRCNTEKCIRNKRKKICYNLKVIQTM